MAAVPVPVVVPPARDDVLSSVMPTLQFDGLDCVHRRNSGGEIEAQTMAVFGYSTNHSSIHSAIQVLPAPAVSNEAVFTGMHRLQAIGYCYSGTARQR